VTASGVGVCRQCGTPVAAGTRFCPSCGANVSDVQGGVATRMVTASAFVPELVDQLREATLGEYEVLTELGRGGMATVFLAHDLQLDRKVAIKVMDPALLKGEGMVERFKLEARTAAQLSHPHIIPIFAVRHQETLLFFVMKFVEGRPLDSIANEVGKFPIVMVQSIVSRVGEALGYAHRRGVVHRDIKPANIMIDVEGQPVVTDFGIAKVADTRGLTMTGATIGTPTYMSPEQCAAGVITGSSDQYSLGVVAYEMLTGHTPFPGDSIVSLLYKHVHEPPPPFQDQRPDCPPGVHDAVMKMLAKKPEDRFPHLEAAVQALGNVTLGFDDPVRVELVSHAKKGANIAALRRVSTPRSPTPVMTGKSRTPGRTMRPGTAAPTVVTDPRAAAPVPQTTSPAAVPRRSRTALAAGVTVLAVAAAALAVTRPWEDRGAASAAAPAAAPASVVIQPHAGAVEAGGTLQLAALTTDSGGRPVAAVVTWISDDTAVATVSQAGLVQALAAGTARIRASAGAMQTGTEVTVTAASAPTVPDGERTVARIRVDGAPGALAVGETVQLAASALDGRGGRISAPFTWASSDPSRARVSAAGLVTAVAVGDVTITARSGTVSQPVRLRITAAAPAGPAVVRVASVSVSSPAGPLTVGASTRLVATVVGEDGRLHGAAVTWRSRNPAVATVEGGVVTGVAPGTAAITASAEEREGSATIIVAAPVAVRPEPPRPETARPEPAPVVSPRDAIAAVVQQYARALQSGQVSEVRRVYPSLPRSQADAVQALGTYEQLQVQLRMDALDVQGDDATATVSGEYQFYSRENRRNERLPVRVRMTLQNGANGWRITGVQQ
jgi:serine/threonine-protein kinase